MGDRRSRGGGAASALALWAAATLAVACDDDGERPDPSDKVKVAEGIYGGFGEPVAFATPEQRATFERGQAVATRRFTPEEGLGPLFNVTFCGACHEKPAFGGAAGRYRNFQIVGRRLDDGTFLLGGHRSGIVSLYGIGEDVPTRPAADEADAVFTWRSSIPFFGVGLIAELSDEAILAHADPEDADGDGISGRPNYEEGFIGRFGRKSQTASIEGFIRGPFNNHLGITSDPLTPEQRAKLPVPSAAAEDGPTFREDGLGVLRRAQAAAPGTPLTDDDDVPDPELSTEDLFDLVSWAMLLAVPEPDPPTERTRQGELTFHEIGCAKCHVPSLIGPRGALPLYSDLLLHDMGPELADGITQGLATGSEFRTQPLWGVVAVAPYLHDGRADTLDEAIRWHGGEAEAAREAYEALADDERADLIAFLESLGGKDVVSGGMLRPDASIPEAPEPGCPTRPLEGEERARWLRGRALFDHEFAFTAGLGPVFNGDSCRACHFDPVIGGAGPLGVNVIRHGTRAADGSFVPPEVGTILHRENIYDRRRPEAAAGVDIYEPRQTPSVLGLGGLDAVPDEAILALADPDDADGDGIRGVAHVLPDGRVGRFGWKAQVPSLREFARDALTAEVGMTVPAEDGFTFGAATDGDEASDPEVTSAQIDDLTFFMQMLAAPVPKEDVPGGRALFEQVGCDTCHVPELPTPDGPVPAYTDLLLHEVGPPDRPGIPDGAANERQFRTPPLLGLSDTAPYLHDGSASTVEAAILAHQGEAEASRAAFESLPAADRATLLRFLEAL